MVPPTFFCRSTPMIYITTNKCVSEPLAPRSCRIKTAIRLKILIAINRTIKILNRD